MVVPTERENSFTARNGGPTWPEGYFLSLFMQRRREMAHPEPTKGFLQLSPEAAMLTGPSVETHPPPPVPPFLLAQNLSPNDITRSDITSRKLYDVRYASIVYNQLNLWVQKGNQKWMISLLAIRKEAFLCTQYLLTKKFIIPVLFWRYDITAETAGSFTAFAPCLLLF